jgi:protein-S-isoprenylcysteine O-methyltransferase Ste14
MHTNPEDSGRLSGRLLLSRRAASSARRPEFERVLIGIGGSMRKLIETVVATIIVPGAAAILIPYLLLALTGGTRPPETGILEALAVIGTLLGSGMIIWVSYAFVRFGKGTPVPLDPPERFVARGLFRYVRNPMYVGAQLIILSEAVFFRSLWLLLYAFGLWLALHTFLIVFEEPQLKERFGESYLAYFHSIPRWLPRLPRAGSISEE